MKAARAPRSSVRRRRARALPSVARRAESRDDEIASVDADAEPARAFRVAEALRSSREALADVQRQLDSLLATVRAPTGRPELDSADQLRRSTRRVGMAIQRLATA